MPAPPAPPATDELTSTITASVSIFAFASLSGESVMIISPGRGAVGFEAGPDAAVEASPAGAGTGRPGTARLPDPRARHWGGCQIRATTTRLQQPPRLPALQQRLQSMV